MWLNCDPAKWHDPVLVLAASKDFVKRAFRMAVDAHRTLVPLSYPPHNIAAACLYLTSFLTFSDDSDSNGTSNGNSNGNRGAPLFEDGWAEKCRCDMQDIEGALADFPLVLSHSCPLRESANAR